MTTQPDIRVSHESAWADEAAESLRNLSEEAIGRRGRFLLALSGGATPRRLYQTLTNATWKPRFRWKHLAFCFGDERCVPPDDAESNYGMAEAELFLPLGIGSEQVYRMEGEHPDARSAAREYEDTLRRVTGTYAPAIPELDLILLGLGEDGHTASLFPGTDALRERTHFVTVGHASRGVPLRLTLTLAAINRASMVLFLVTGKAKAEMVRRVLASETDADRQLPAALVQPDHGRLVWLLDGPAAGALSQNGLRKEDAT